MILQKNGKATPSVAASLIERLPDAGDPQRFEEERVAKNVVFIAYGGTWCVVYIANLGRPTDFFIPHLARSSWL
jgi:hypothetical protein